MLERRHLNSLLFIIVGLILAIYTLLVFAGIPAGNLLVIVSANLYENLVFFTLLSIPILMVSYLLLGRLTTVLILAISKIIYRKSSDLRIKRVGHDFRSMQMIKRSVMPSLLAITMAPVFRQPLEALFFGVPPILTPALQDIYPIALTLLASLIALPVTLTIFIPTWLLNDSGLVFESNLETANLRQPKQTIGVGRIYYYLLAGFTVYGFAAYVISRINVLIMSWQYGGISQLQYQIFLDIWLLVGVSIMVMAVVVPVVILHEVILGKATSFVIRVAKRRGAIDDTEESLTEMEIILLPDTFQDS
ncbi:MAG: hypothetical protein RTU30_11915 [Candidatus Thorarchaeota archaeon]